MNSKFFGVALVFAGAATGYSNNSFAAPTCYDVTGSVNTVNLSQSTQGGDIHLTLSKQNAQGKNKVVFDEQGVLVGRITNATMGGPIFLSHVALFGPAGSFMTEDDEAILLPTSDCSFDATETISNIVGGTGFFRNVTSVEVVAEGYISFCPNANENFFELSGSLCVE